MASGQRFPCSHLAWALLLGLALSRTSAAEPSASEVGPAIDAPSPDAVPEPTAKSEDDPARRWGNRNAIQWIISRGKNRFDVVEWMSRPDLFTLGNLGDWTAAKEYDLDSGLGFDIRWWTGPQGDGVTPAPDLPPRVYDLYYQGVWRQRWADNILSEVCVRPGLYTDFRTTPPRSFRAPGHAVGVFRLDTTLSLVAGVQHLQRNQIKVLPIAGVLWEPNERWQCRLVFPEPKVTYRLGPCGDLLIYGRGEYGGGTWAYKTDEGRADQVEYSDVRAAVGFEWGGAKPWRFPAATGFMEVGYVFDRHLRFAGGLPNQGVPAGWMLCLGSTW